MVCKPPAAFPLALPKDACGLDSSFLCGAAVQSVLRLQYISDTLPTGSTAPAKVKKLVLSCHLPSEARLRCRHHALLAMVHAPESVKLSKVHIGLDPAILSRWKRVSRSGAEEAPVRAGAAALGVGVGRLQGQSGALVSESRSGFIQGGGTVRAIDHLALRRHDEGQSHTGLAGALGT